MADSVPLGLRMLGTRICLRHKNLQGFFLLLLIILVIVLSLKVIDSSNPQIRLCPLHFPVPRPLGCGTIVSRLVALAYESKNRNRYPPSLFASTVLTVQHPFL